MVRANFEKELQELHSDIIQMGALVETAIEESIKAFTSNDFALCKTIIDQDKIVDETERRIEAKCLWLITREQPVASDLRKITAALKIITDMERIGDQAADIAELTMRIADENSFAKSSQITKMAVAAAQMVNNAITAYVNYDLNLAKATQEQDDQVDNYFNLIKEELVQVFMHQPENIDNAIDYLLVAKYLERIADHAVNICEWVYFAQTGKHKNFS